MSSLKLSHGVMAPCAGGLAPGIGGPAPGMSENNLLSERQRSTSRPSPRLRFSRRMTTTRGLSSSTQTQDVRRRQVEGNFAGH